MKIKTKLNLGVGLLFILILLLSLVGAFYIYALKSDTSNILVSNYNSLEYSRKMLSSLSENNPKSLEQFESSLIKQEANLTEEGEKEATKEVRTALNKFKQDKTNSSNILQIQNGIFKIMNLNMIAINRKSQVALNTANRAVFWIAITGLLCFIIAFTLLVNLPSNIANPINELTESIKQIAAKNYSERVHFESHNEFGELASSFNVMAKKLEEYSNSSLAKLMKEKKRIETLINNMQDPVIGLDENLDILFVNDEAIKIINIKKEDLIGINIKKISEKNDLIRLLTKEFGIEKIDPKSKQEPIKIYTENKEGYFEKETIHISITPIGETTKQVIGHVILLRNITEYKELDFAKTNFIATVSHEFKTPISSIKMSLQLLENKQIGNLNSEQMHLISSIKEDANRLLKITGELLNMTQVESGNIQLNIIPSDIVEILNYALDTVKIQAEQKNIQILLDVPNNLPKVNVDNEKTAWVLTNLISNAIRYSYDNSSININIIYSSDVIELQVKDYGQGISDQYKDKIFNRYFRVPGTNKEGTGLGLAISKEFIEAQGGNISVESEYGLGSTFIITLLPS